MTLQEPAARPGLSNKARELMEQINTDAGKDNIWVRTQMNAPAQRPWFTDTGGATGTGAMASGRVAANQMSLLQRMNSLLLVIGAVGGRAAARARLTRNTISTRRDTPWCICTMALTRAISIAGPGAQPAAHSWYSFTRLAYASIGGKVSKRCTAPVSAKGSLVLV